MMSWHPEKKACFPRKGPEEALLCHEKTERGAMQSKGAAG